MSRKLLTLGGSYELDTRDASLNEAAHRQTVWIVSIEDETGYIVTTARCAGNQDEVNDTARDWLNALCRRNPGKLLRFVLRMANN